MWDSINPPNLVHVRNSPCVFAKILQYARDRREKPHRITSVLTTWFLRTNLDWQVLICSLTGVAAL